ncbi:MAG: cupin domain-containing protein [Lysobacteraceae bacterium]|nr:MAG: cupin domain-containing protein [Xanthomonadaceae bacterium]
MTALIQPIRKLAKANTDFRREVMTGRHAQVVVMCLLPGEDIGEEVHAGTDQLFQVVKGHGEALVDGVSRALGKGVQWLVPAGVRHNLRNTGGKRLRLVTIYSPPRHAVGTVQATRADAAHADGTGGRRTRRAAK